jgi:hypothetical protein
MSAIRTKENPTQHLVKLRQRYETVASSLNTMAKESASGSFEYRFLNYLGPYVMYVFSPNDSNGEVEIVLTSIKSDIRPTFTATSSHDRKWFEYFVGQFKTA